MSPEQLSEILRTGEGTYLWCRRAIMALPLVAALCMQFIALYQMGLIRHLPEPPLPRMNADKVDAAPEAYSRLGLPIPDALLGLVSYAITAALASLGAADRYARWPWLLVVLAMGLKVAVDAVQAGRLSWEQWDLHRAFCFWCLVAATASFLAVPLAVPETWAALKRLVGEGYDQPEDDRAPR